MAGTRKGRGVDAVGSATPGKVNLCGDGRQVAQGGPRVEYLPETHQRKWLYYKLFPNVAFDIYPDQVDFMQFLPVSPTQTLIREIAYVHPDDRREMRAARYLNWRINRRVNIEDKALIERVQAGMGSSSYTVGPLSTGEVCLRSFARRMRALRRDTSPFATPPRERGASWVEPQLVAQITFAEWTAGDKLRQPVFLGLRDDKPAKDVNWRSRER